MTSALIMSIEMAVVKQKIEHASVFILQSQMLKKINRMMQALDNEMEKMSNLTESVRSAEEDIRYLRMATSNFYAILTKQAKVIHQQNVTMSPIILKVHNKVVLGNSAKIAPIFHPKKYRSVGRGWDLKSHIDLQKSFA